MISCNENKIIEENLRKESYSFFKRKNINHHDFKTNFYIKSNKDIGYTHYVLKCYKILENDSLIIYFSRDDSAAYWIETNDLFKEHYK